MSTISIIGSGNLAGAIGARAVKGGHTVEVAARSAAKADAPAKTLDGGATTAKFGCMAHWVEGAGVLTMGLARYGVGNFDFFLGINNLEGASR